MKRRIDSALAALVVLACAVAPAGAVTFQVLEDTYSASGLISKSTGTAASLLVGPKNAAYIKFGVTNSGLIASQVSDARLTIYFPSVSAAGTLEFFANSSDFSEILTKSAHAPTQNTTNLAALAVTAADKKIFMVVDVTAQVQAWLAGSMPDYGFAITSTNGAKVTIGSKEGPATGYPAVLEVDAVPPSIVGTNAALSGNVTAASFSGNGNGLTSLNASQLTSGTVPLAQLPAAVVTNNESSVTLSNLTVTGNLSLPGNLGNTALGSQSLEENTSGSNNTAVGFQTLYRTAEGTNNIALGYEAGAAFTGSESSNIDIGNAGVAGENGITRIGAPGIQTNAFIAGIIYGDGSGLSNLSVAQYSSVVTNTETGVSLGGAFTGSLTGNAATATTASNVISGLAMTNAVITQSTFAGDGGGLTNLNASQFSSGTIPFAQLPAAVITNNATSLILGSVNEIAPLTIPPNISVSAVGSVPTGSSPVCVTVAGRYAYVANFAAATLQIIDVGNPSAPVSVGSVSTGSLPYSVAVAGRYAYVVNFGNSTLQVFDVSNPWVPVSIGSVGTGSEPISVAVAGRYAYVVNFIASTLQVFDVSNPSAPVNVGSVGTGNGPHSLAVSGRYAYVVNANANSLQVFDVSNPSAPANVGSVGTGNSPASVAVASSYAYVVNNSANNLQVFDVSNPSAPISVGLAATGSHPDWVAVAGRYACVANVNADTLQVFDVSAPAMPVSVGSIVTVGGSASFAVAGRYAYVVNGGNSMQIFDLGGAYVQQLEAGAMETGTLQTRDTVTVGNNLNVSGGLTVSASAFFSGGLSVNNGAITASNITAANISAATFSGNGGSLTNLSINAAELPATVVTNNETSVTLGNLTLTGSLTLPVNNNNTPIGNQALAANTSGLNDTAVGFQALYLSTDGTNNIALGYEAGSAFTGTESSNIDIGNAGVLGENGIIRIGATGVQTATYLAGTVYADSVALTSDRNAKENFTPIDAEIVLTKVAALPMTEWNYKKDGKSLRHIGPMAQDFETAFGLNGGDDKHISTVDEGGVALAAIQGLNEKLKEKDAEIQDLKAKAAQVDLLEKRLNNLAEIVQSLTAKK